MRRVSPARRTGPALVFAIVSTFACVNVPGLAAAAPGGPIGNLPLGHYQCELPGDVTGPAGIRQPEADFTITYGSTYRMAERQGTYLLTGERVVFTAGPIKGVVFQRNGNTFLRQIKADGTAGRLRCVRQGSALRQ